MISALPGWVKAVLVSPWFLVLLFAGSSWVVYVEVVDRAFRFLEHAERKETELRQTFEAKQKKAVMLEPVKRRYDEMVEQFGSMLRQLPGEIDTVRMHLELTQHALAAGANIDRLDFHTPAPNDEHDYYVEQSGTLIASGSFESLAGFVTRFPSLEASFVPRSVTLQYSPRQGNVRMSTEFYTMRYITEEEIEEKEPTSKRKKKRKL